jgi:hypothetical protein
MPGTSLATAQAQVAACGAFSHPVARPVSLSSVVECVSDDLDHRRRFGSRKPA